MRFDGREEQMELLREVAENILDPVFLVDRNFNVWYYNRAFENAVGVRMSSRQYKARPCYELLGLSICKDACVMKAAVAANKTQKLAEIPGVTAGGERKNFHINAIPVARADGQPFGSLIFLRDITAETQIHEKYKQLVNKNSAMSLSGNIETGNLVDVVQLFVFLQKTGQLTLQHSGNEGVVWFERGQMVGIECAGAFGAKALDRLLAWPDGQFSFSPKVAREPKERLTGSADFMLMNAVRERDEINARLKDIPPLDARPQVLRIASAEEEGLNEGANWPVYEAAVEGKSVGQMIETMPLPDTRIVLALLALKDKQIVTF